MGTCVSQIKPLLGHAGFVHEWGMMRGWRKNRGRSVRVLSPHTYMPSGNPLINAISTGMNHFQKAWVASWEQEKV